MCLAIPMRIAEIDGVMAVTELHGVTRRASIMLVPQAQVGDYILVHAGCAITVLDETEAQETLQLLSQIAALDQEDEGDQEGERSAEADDAAPGPGARRPD